MAVPDVSTALKTEASVIRYIYSGGLCEKGGGKRERGIKKMHVLFV